MKPTTAELWVYNLLLILIGGWLGVALVRHVEDIEFTRCQNELNETREANDSLKKENYSLIKLLEE